VAQQEAAGKVHTMPPIRQASLVIADRWNGPELRAGNLRRNIATTLR